MTWWLSAGFTALLAVTVVGVGIWFLPVMFAPPERRPDFDDVDELLKVSPPVRTTSGGTGTGGVKASSLAARPGTIRGPLSNGRNQ